MHSWFPDSYHESRSRFRQAADKSGATLTRLPVEISGESDLTIDVATIGSADQPAVIVTSGLHGVEGPSGAAIQLAWLASQAIRSTPGRFVLVHALNPYGYLHGRRVNEDNIDLNRNFPNTEYGSSDSFTAGLSDYARFDALLNPAYPPRQFDGFLPKALGYLVREGQGRLQKAIVTGQYDFPRGLFYGGKHPARAVQLLEENISYWVAQAPQVCHIDIHTGLGRFSQCQLLVQSTPESEDYTWFEQAFGANTVVATQDRNSSVYEARGAMGSWLTQRCHDRPYRFLTAEFGTYPALKVLTALRRENQAFHHAGQHRAVKAMARAKLEECFCPSSLSWRDAVVARGLRLIEQAAYALSEDN